MRFTTILASLVPGLALTAGACIAEVGGDECVGQRCKKDGSGGGSDATTPPTCDNPEELLQNVTLRSAADFDALPDGCWSLNGDLRIEGPAVTSLAKLGELIEVNNLELVDTGLVTIDTAKPFQVWGSLLVSGNTKLTSLANLAVKRWDGATQGGAPWHVDYTVRNNAQLTSIDGLKYIGRVDGDLRITDNAKLGALELAELATVGGAVYVSSTAATSIRLPALSQVARLEITNNPQLTQVGPLTASTTTGDVVVRGNPALTTLAATRSLTNIGGALIVDNTGLVDLAEATTNLQYVGGQVQISNNTKLTALGRLSRLPSGTGSTVAITGNPQLSYCLALEVDHCVPTGTVTIQNNQNANNCNCWCGQ